MLAPNTKIKLQKNQYRIIKKIGFGAYGVVWQAERINEVLKLDPANDKAHKGLEEIASIYYLC